MRQACIDDFRRLIDFGRQFGAKYIRSAVRRCQPCGMLSGKPDIVALDALVKETAKYFFERESEVLTAGDEHLIKTNGG